MKLRIHGSTFGQKVARFKPLSLDGSRGAASAYNANEQVWE
jgi:hypothetical protein